MNESVYIVSESGESMFFDAMIRSDSSSKLKLTSHPVEEGADITDHAYLEPDEISMEIKFSDVNGGDGHSLAMYHKLHGTQKERQPVTLYTKFKKFKNMMIETITTPDDYTTLHNFSATIGFREIIIVSSDTVSIGSSYSSANADKTGKTNVGTVQVDTTNKSVLKQAYDAVFG